MKVAIIGGSIAGLSTGVALSCIGCDVDVYEWSSALLHGRGGGLVVQHEMLEWMTVHGIATMDVLSLRGVERQFLDRNGQVISRFPDATPFTSWDAVYHQLQGAFPIERYHLGYRCERLSEAPGAVTVEFANAESVTADLVIGADGIGSTVRAYVAPEVRPRYAGYVAWRGVIPEQQAPHHIVETLANRFTLFQGDDFHVLSYLIPGEHGELVPGARRLNWVWYWNTDEDTELHDMLTDTDGNTHHSSVPSGKVQPQYVDALQKRAGALLPSVLSALVHATPQPFVQVIFDLLCPRLFKGRVALIGDSACIVRPHTASGTSKASGDAVALAQHLQAHQFALDRALPRWEVERLAFAERLVHHGLRLARGSRLGV